MHDRSENLSVDHQAETDRSVAFHQNWNIVSNEQNKLRFKIKENLIKQAKQEFELEDQIGVKKRKGSANRQQEEVLDRKTRLQPDSVSASDNKDLYLKKYSINMEFPGAIIQDSKFFKQDSRYCLQLFNYLVPDINKETAYKKKDKQKTFYSTQEYEKESFSPVKMFNSMIGRLAPNSKDEDKTDVPVEEEEEEEHHEVLRKQHMRVFTHHDGLTSEKSMKDIYGDRIDGVTLRLLKKDEHGSI